MRYLIDTNLFVHLVENDHISDSVSAILDSYENTFYMSAESVKELIHLVQIGRIAGQKYKKRDIFSLIEDLRISVKYVGKEHLQTLEKLEPVKGHNDPSDRLIIAQAITENLPLISSDLWFQKYTKQGLTLIMNTKK